VIAVKIATQRFLIAPQKKNYLQNKTNPICKRIMCTFAAGFLKKAIIR
jgi:hypothetical protein